jgi:transcriptional regulator with XRE-family HTH domain
VAHAQMRAIRYSKGLTQRQVAIDLDVTQAAIYQWENKIIARPRPAMAKRLSDYFGVPIEMLLAPETKTAPTKKAEAAEESNSNREAPLRELHNE